MQAIVTLLLLCLVMGFGSFAIGLVPLVFELSPRRVRLISALGIGVLVGTSLVVIIPEGVETLYSSQKDKQHHKTVGLSLLAGFMFMYVIDTLPTYISKRKMGQFMAVPGIDMSNLRFRSATPTPAEQEAGGVDASGSPKSKKPVSTAIGLIIHSVADGIALGASVSTQNSALEMMVFLAIMVHKAPASFGFTAVMLREKVTISTIRRSLAMFAAGAPVGAIGTYLIIKLIGASDHVLIESWTGTLLLFSGGTFLFVAVHAMQDMHDPKNSTESTEDNGPELGLSMIGMLVPLLTLLVPDM